MSSSLLVIAALIAASAFLSIAEFSLASSRRIRLQQLSDEGDPRAALALAIQQNPGHYFTVVQICINAVAILGGIVGEGALTPYFQVMLSRVMDPAVAADVAFAVSFGTITVLFILLSDLLPKRLSMNEPERMAMLVIGPMSLVVSLLKPLAWLFSKATEAMIHLLGRPAARDDSVTQGDILALTEAGRLSGVVAAGEQQLITNIFELDTRSVESVMTTRENIVFFSRDEDEPLIRHHIVTQPHSTYLVCDGEIDKVIGYVDATALFARVLRGEPLDLRSNENELIRKVLIVPDRLSLSEMLTQFRQALEDFAVIVNEYSLVVGVITLNDVMNTVMGSLVAAQSEEQIVRRDDGSFLADGLTPVVDVQRALGVEGWPHPGQYDTLAGFLMVMMRRIPRRTDHIEWSGWRFEVMDVDNHRVDQVMISRVAPS